jgi:DNA-binding HxlR family transcriptional regulator
MLGSTYGGQDCSVARSLEIFGERWTLLVLRDALYGVRRFSDFADHLDIPRAVLSDRLRKLVANGVLTRSTHGGTGGSAVVYELTDAGRDLWPVVHALAHWGQRHASDVATPRIFTHATCGSRLNAHAHCPACDVTPAVADVVTSRPGKPRRSDRVSAELAKPHRMLEPV